MDDRTEEILRSALANVPRPWPSPAFAAAVLQRVAAGPSSPERRQRRGGRVLLGAYWLGASLATVLILRVLSWPSWAPSVLWAMALALVPLGYATFLWPDRLGGCVLVCLRPLFGRFEGRAPLR